MTTGPRQTLAVALAIAAATIGVYAGVRNHEFLHYDDDRYIVENPMLRSPLAWGSVRGAFLPYHDNWIPLTWLSLQMDAALFGIRADAFLLGNVALHSLAAALLLAALVHLTGALGPSAFCAAVFALHPLHVESVAWASERKDVLSGLFFASTLLAYARYTEGPHSARRYGAVTLFLVLTLLAKPMGVTLPFVLLLLDIWPLRRLRIGGEGSAAGGRHGSDAPRATVRRVILEKVPWIALCVGVAGVALAVQRESGAMLFGDELALSSRFGNALRSWVDYLAATFWPVKLAVFYPHSGSVPPHRTLASGALLGAVTFAVLIQLRKRPHLAVGWLWFLGTLVPVIGLVQVGMQARADRYTYLPQVGISIAIAWWAAEGATLSRAMRGIAAGGAVISLILLATLTHHQVKVWNNTTTLFEHALRVTQDNHVAHHQLAAERLRQGRLGEAEHHFREAIRAEARFALPEIGLGEALSRQSRSEEAVSHYQRALEIEPGRPEVRVKLGLVLLNAGRGDEAQEAFKLSLVEFSRTRRRDPAEAVAHFGLAELSERDGLLDAAIQSYRRGLEVAPDQAQGRVRLARLLARRGERELALEQALRSSPYVNRAQAPDLLRTLESLAEAFRGSGDGVRARSASRAAHELTRRTGSTEPQM